NRDAALPILKRYGFPATIFISGAVQGGASKYGIERLTSADVVALARSGDVEIESHGMTHRMLTQLANPEVASEIRESKSLLEALIGLSVTCFAYPYGAHDDAVVALVRDAGYTAAVTTRAGDVRPGADRYRLPRFAITCETNDMQFRAMLAGGQPLKRASFSLLGCRFGASVLARAVRRLWAVAEAHGVFLVSKPLLRLIRIGRTEPLMLSEGDVQALARGKTRARAAREKAPGAMLTSLVERREDLVSIGVFAYNRLDLLERTCAALATYLGEYGHTFAHEVLFFHDGPNEEIRAWAERQPLFDRVIFNEENRGLSYNLNRFWYEESKGAFILDLEDDWVCEYQDNFIAHALDILKSNAEVGSVSLERREPDDYKVWNRAARIKSRIFSALVRTTPQGHRYRLLPHRCYGNSCTLYRFSSLALAGRLRDDRVRRRAQEGEYMRAYSRLWMGARGVYFKDNPFLHIGRGRSAPTWSQ
ncbi:MAG TPA: polysaccharide deacetylase family protein, partial [Candidatus Paceibacterota bacterium]|nr:polysaccharide deacetylase family protein [Candidatus Paceibacterota bacterium]